MDSTPESKSDAALPAGIAFALCGTVAVLCAAVIGWSAPLDAAPGPFVWWDVALVYTLGAVPMAAQIASGMRRKRSTSVVLMAALGCLLIARFLIPAFRSVDVVPPGMLRLATALFLATGGALLVALWAKHPLRPAIKPGWRNTALVIVLNLALAWLVPGAYAATRLRHHVNRLQELLDEARVGECRRLADDLFGFDPSLRVRGVPPQPDRETSLRVLVAMLDEQVRGLQAHVSRPLPSSAGSDDRLARAEELAMLGREPEALEVLAPLTDAETPDPRACGLLGVIRETREDFSAAREAFERAAGLWEAQPPSVDRDAGLAQAVRGIAYAERKLGRYPAADAAYQRLLALDPTAETHFLLAKFYEDTQQTAAARIHARRAIELAPESYSAPGRELIDALATRHFGCLPVYVEERSRDAP